jgi:hypothetical protein
VSSNIETLLEAMAFALDNTVPDVRADVPFIRWTGEDKVERAPLEIRERKYQLRLGASLKPRTISSLTSQWQRAELLVVVGYNFTEPRQQDTQQSDLGVHVLPWIDQRCITLAMGNVFSSNTGVKRLLFLSADPPGESSRTWRFDLEWSESF